MPNESHKTEISMKSSVDERGLEVIAPTQERREDVTLPTQVTEKIVAAGEIKEAELKNS